MKITIPKPCHENWDAMTPDEKGKFCSVCSKTVHDFTDCTDEEPINTYKSDEDMCGRFREDQLDRNLGLSLISKLTLGLLAIGGSLTTANAQEVQPERVKQPVAVRGINMTSSVVNDTIRKNKVEIRIGAPVSRQQNKPLLIMDDKKISEAELTTVKPENVESARFLSIEESIKQYGKEGQHGVVVFTTKKKGKIKK
ncbi:hypothetical protein [Chryseobacterium sp. PMSZPI]|uniref:hypothetical protein n=1 Tax=Chryseobacterium sp. PMSZPI TaxID=1033900 RepID=UPI000C32F255|nr:hypothetical protein [Chryseobacterium sp. PMSZPI]PKF75659.1 hypothetical protein CW752_03310 [Chryseobacterium sp. PMSZPI]